MGFYVCNGSGDSAKSPSLDTMRTFLDGLDPEDEEHGAAWLTDDEGNSLEYGLGGNLCFSRADQLRHLPHVSKERVIELWLKLASGRLNELEREPWQPGARPPMPPEERAARERCLAEAQLASDRKFYDALGPERAMIPCRDPGCTRGTVALSVFCRRHHFESVWRRTCPFDG